MTYYYERWFDLWTEEVDHLIYNLDLRNRDYKVETINHKTVVRWN